jgi:hypothetical protein
MANLYWKNSGSGAWEDAGNWWTNAAATAPAANAPWVDGVDSIYLAYNLTLATVSPTPPVIDGLFSFFGYGTGATGVCDISGISCGPLPTINGGTWTGSGFTSGGFGIYGGTFTGSGFTNNTSIYLGTFTGAGFSHNGGTIYNGTFTGAGFSYNSGFIFNGTFTGDGFTQNADINGGTFSGTNFTSSGGAITAGTFSGAGFFMNQYPANLRGGTFLKDAVSVSTDSTNTYLTMVGGGYQIKFGYPTPAAPPASDQTIARLLNLPWFINL